MLPIKTRLCCLGQNDRPFATYRPSPVQTSTIGQWTSGTGDRDAVFTSLLATLG